MTLIVVHNGSVFVDSRQTKIDAVHVTIDKRIRTKYGIMCCCGNPTLLDQVVTYMDFVERTGGEPWNVALTSGMVDDSTCIVAKPESGPFRGSVVLMHCRLGEMWYANSAPQQRVPEDGHEMADIVLGSGRDMFVIYNTIMSVEEALTATAKAHRDCGLPIETF